MHTIAIDPVDRIVTVTYRERVTIAERIEVLERLLAMFADSDYRRLLVDFHDAQSTVEEFAACKELARRLDALGVHGCQIAYVGPAGRAINPVVEALSAARGLLFERFDDNDEAREWLRAVAA